MRAVVTRVKEASVVIEGKTTGKIGQGFLILLGIGPEDTESIADKMAEKICNCRVFEDENGKMNLSLDQVGGSLLVISQFTLYADLKKRRPGFPMRPNRNWRFPCMRDSWRPAVPGVLPWNTGSSPLTCRCIP